MKEMYLVVFLLSGSLLLVPGCGKSKAQVDAEVLAAEKARTEIRRKMDEEEKQFQEKLNVIAAPKQVASTTTGGQGAITASRSENTELIKKFQDKLLLRLKDPSSAQFRDVKLNFHGDALCGQVNAKNGYGGYNGFKGFVVTEAGAYTETEKDGLEDLLYKGTAKQQGCIQ